MSATQYLQDVATRHQIFLERFGNGRGREAEQTLNRLRRDINARLSQEPADFHRNRLNQLLIDIEQLSLATFDSMGVKTLDQIGKLAPVEASFSAELFNTVTNIDTGYILPADSLLATAAIETPLAIGSAAGFTPKDAMNKFSDAKTKEILTKINDSVILGLDTREIANEVGGLVNTLHKRQTRSLINTLINHTSSVARNEIYKSNSKYLDGYRWIATLDSKTTLICGSRDRKVYLTGLGPLPPAHYNCRSTTIPAVKKEFQVAKGATGKRPSIGSDGVEPVNNNLSYGTWLKSQPTEFIDEALGVERSRLFRSGKMKIDKFVDPTGRVYTLQELEGMKPISMIET